MRHSVITYNGYPKYTELTRDSKFDLEPTDGYSAEDGNYVWLLSPYNDTKTKALMKKAGKYYSTVMYNGEITVPNSLIRPYHEFQEGDVVVYWSRKASEFNHRFNNQIYTVKAIRGDGVVFMDGGLVFDSQYLLFLGSGHSLDESKLQKGAYVQVKGYDDMVIYVGMFDGDHKAVNNYTRGLVTLDDKEIENYNVYGDQKDARIANLINLIVEVTPAGSPEEQAALALSDVLDEEEE